MLPVTNMPRGYCMLLISSIALMLTASCERDNSYSEKAIKSKIMNLMDRQQEAWNRGDIDAFMQGYWKANELRFASGGQVHYGWETLRQRYKRSYPDTEAMGELNFSDRDISVLSPDNALLFGRWRLTRSKDTLSGLYTLVFKNTDKGWKIIHDHTSSQ